MSSRKQFLKSVGLAMTGATIFPLVSLAKNSIKNNSVEEPKLDAKLIQKFVTVCHGNFEMVKELYQKEPLLIYCSHDWGNGDFENGIDAAGHVGNKEITHFLLQKGARINFFTMCMLGKFEVVSPLLKEFPNLIHTKGPHGFTALHHANQGGEEAIKIKELLESLGAKETKVEL